MILIINMTFNRTDQYEWNLARRWSRELLLPGLESSSSSITFENMVMMMMMMTFENLEMIAVVMMMMMTITFDNGDTIFMVMIIMMVICQS